MRECIYCGKQLEKGEKCQCAMAVAKRKERDMKNDAKDNSAEQQKVNDKERKKREKQQEKEKAREKKKREKENKKQKFEYAGQNIYGSARKNINKNMFRNVWTHIKSFFLAPFETVMNPGLVTTAEIFTIVIIEGIIAGLCVFSIITGASRGSLRLLTSLMGFGGTAGYQFIIGWLEAAVSGAVTGCVIFILYTAVFYFINRWLFRQATPFWEFGKRLVFVGIPFTVIGAIGVLLGFFSQTTFAILLLTGLVSLVILTYEVLRSMWISYSASKVMYSIMLGYVIFFIIIMYLIRASLIF